MELPGYQVGEIISKTGHEIIYKGKAESGASVRIKVPTAEGLDASRGAAYRRSFKLVNKIEDDVVVDHLEFLDNENTPVLILESYYGQILESAIPTNGFRLESLIEISLGLAKKLSKLHASNILHNGVKPANVIIDLESQNVRFSNLEEATHFGRNANPITTSVRLEEMLAYAPPERCGRIESHIDDRSDLYSLGITLFQLASGELPFIVLDKGALAYAHIAHAPKELKQIRPDLPDVFSQIVSRLLEKNPEDRYVSAIGLVRDLEKCSSEIQRTGTVRQFQIAQNDVPSHFRIPDKLYGREVEFERLIDAFGSCCLGKRTLVSVTGISGVGKTALVNALQKHILNNNGFYASGKFDQFQLEQPYLALIQVARLMVKKLLSEPEDKLLLIKSSLQDALGAQGRLLTDVLPELEIIIGPQPDYEEVPHRDAARRFHGVVARFISVFATAETPLVVFIDDLQWADIASYNLLHALAIRPELNYLMFVFGYRANEVGVGHPVIEMMSAFKASAVVSHEIEIGALSEQNISTMLSETLHSKVTKVSALGGYLHKVATGNIFFVREFLQALYERDFFKFNREKNLWEWDLQALNNQAIPDNVAELLTYRLAELPASCLDILDTASCVGNEFDLHTLSSVHEISPELVAQQMAPAVENGLVVPLTSVQWVLDSLKESNVDKNSNKDFDSGVDKDEIESISSPKFRFQHDQVHEKVHDRLDDARRIKRHMMIGELLLKNLSEEELHSRAVNVFSHLAYCVQVEQDETKRKTYAHLGLVAGRNAYQRLAFSAARTQLKVAVELLPENSWKTDYRLTLGIYMLLAECAFALEKKSEFENISSLILDNVTSAIDAARTQGLRIRLLSTELKYDDAVDMTIQVVKSLGMNTPRKPNLGHVLSGVSKVLIAQRGRDPAVFENLPDMSNKEMIEAVNVLTQASSAAYFSEPNLLPLIGIISTRCSIKYGLTASSSYGFAVWALILCGVLGRIDMGYRFGNLAMNIGKRYGGVDESRGRFVVNCFIKHWKDPLKDVCGYLYNDWGLNKDAGDEESAVYCIGVLLYTEFFAGNSLDADQKYKQAVQYLLKSNKHHVKYSFLAWVQLYELLRAPQLAEDLSGEWFNLEEKLPEFEQSKNGVQIAISQIAAGILDFYAERYERAASRFEIAAANEDKIVGQVLIPGLAFFRALNAYRMFAIQPHKKWLKIARKQTARIRKWAKFSPVNLDHRLSLLKAEELLVRGKTADAVMELHKAYEQATYEGKMYQALAAKRLGEILFSAGSKSQADLMNINADTHFKEWGAVALTSAAPFNSLKTSDVNKLAGSSLESSYSFDSHDLHSLLRAMGAISSEINRETLLKKLMTSLIQSASADRGVLIIMNNAEKPMVEIDTRFDGEWVNPRVALEDFHQVARPIIDYAMRTSRMVVVNDAQNDDRLANDPYFKNEQVRAVLASTIKIQGRMIGLIYLENSVARGAFNKHRVQMIEALAAQAGIALENAKLYSGMQKALEQQKELNDANRRFVPEEIITSLGYKSIVDVNLNEAIERDMNIVFVDLRSFTSISLEIGAKKTIDMINRYLSHIQPSILAHNGFVGNYMGDAVLAVFPGDADNSLHGAITMSRGLMGYNRDRGDFPKLDFGIGIHSGLVTLGMIGDVDHIQCGVIGDSVNASSRIEGLTTFYGTTAIISQTTYDRLIAPDRFALRPLGQVELEGRSEIIRIYELLDLYPDSIQEKIQSTQEEFKQALNSYTQGDWQQAHKLFKELIEQCPEDQVSYHYAERCKSRISIEIDWDGIEKPGKIH